MLDGSDRWAGTLHVLGALAGVDGVLELAGFSLRVAPLSRRWHSGCPWEVAEVESCALDEQNLAAVCNVPIKVGPPFVLVLTVDLRSDPG